MSNPGEPIDWRQRDELGSAWLIRWSVRAVLLAGRRFAHALVVFIAFYYLLRRPSERLASRQYLTRVLNRRPNGWDTYKHFLTFALVNVDRLFFLANQHASIEVNFHGQGQLLDSVSEGRGGLFIAAHFGSFEAARNIAVTHRKTRVRIVIHRALNAKLMSQLEALNPGFANDLIDAEQSPAALGLEIAESVERGEWIGFLADRSRPGSRTIQSELLGSRAEFAQGAYAIGAAFKLPIYSIFSVYSAGKYEVYCDQISARFEPNRPERGVAIAQASQRFADLLGKRMQAAPYNWFNFYDFWASKSS